MGDHPQSSDKPQSDNAAQRQRDIQHTTDQRDARQNQTPNPNPIANQSQGQSQSGGGQSGGKQQQAVQVGTHAEPAPPFPPQHLEKPGLESDLDPRPRFMAPGYK